MKQSQECSGKKKQLPKKLLKLKEVMGVSQANCESCNFLSSEGDGPEYNGSWPVCSKIERMGYLKSFPFKKDMKCWQPNFWFSKMAETVEDEESCDKAAEEFGKALKNWRKIYESVSKCKA